MCINWFSVVFITILATISCIKSSTTTNINNIFTGRSIGLSLSTSLSMPTSLVKSIGIGVHIAQEHCKSEFKWERWNCPESSFTRRNQRSATKEVAFVKAILAAGIVHTITKNCSRDEIEGCGCDPALGAGLPSSKLSGRIIDQAVINGTNHMKPLPNGEPVKWTWGGCSDHIDYGLQISKAYLDDLEASDDPESSIHLHNNEIGRDVVKSTMVKRCVCHGVSGSCALQTCWMQVAPFAVVARKLKQKYKHSIQIEVERDNSAVGQAVVDIPDSNDLVYVDASPNYCKPHNASSWRGTKNRKCSRNRSPDASWAEKRSCRNICRSCGHRIRKDTKIVKERCNCSFKWCCEVKCQICTKTVTEFSCE